MCTVTYIPLNEREYILTSNRDESPLRKRAEHPEPFKVGNKNVIYPRDPVAGGTWIASAEDGYTLCLLNGAFVRHEYEPPYRHSRGKVVLDFFSVNDPAKFVSEYDFHDLEPFTLLFINRDAEVQTSEMRWDGLKAHYRDYDPLEPYIRSSASLYEDPVIRKKEELFNEWIRSEKPAEPDTIFSFHRNAQIGDPENDFVMNRNNIVKTVSITQVIRKNSGPVMLHSDLESEERSQISLANA